MRGPDFLPSADDGLLVSFDSIAFDELHGLASAVRVIERVAATITGHASLLVLVREAGSVAGVRREIESILAHGIVPRESTSVETHALEVDFSAEHAPDLPQLLARAHLSRDDFLSRVASLELRARYLGFLPGFAYLEGWPEEWSLPRRAVARERVPWGSFGIAGAMAGFYAVESPGGWNLLGRTGATLWDPNASRPNRIAAGDLVRIRPGSFVAEESAARVDAPKGAEPILAEVLGPGLATIVTGEARDERLAFGLAPGGAFDDAAMRLANRLVANRDGATLLECAGSGPRMRFVREATIAIAGAEATATLDGVRLPMRTMVAVGCGATLDVGVIRGGMRVVVAVRGGVADPSPRWSARPPRIGRGELLAVAGETGLRRPLSPPAPGNRLQIGAVPGPHAIDSRHLDHLFDREWTVTPSLDRTGVRLESGAPPVALPALLPSCGMRFGSVQWHPGGELVVMGPDHPITGGYLQPLTVPRRELWKIAQLVPGERVQFVMLRE
ncbi:MAG: urea amidolyase family protein [Thermoanaerobaculia bacterium]|nr:urea amidolyase family protein [Thermoanaerobaculia bacterium]